METQPQLIPEEKVEYDPKDEKPVLAYFQADPEIERAIQAGTQVVFDQKKEAV